MRVEKRHQVSGVIISVSGLALAFLGLIGFQYASADALIGEAADVALLAIFAGAVLVIAAVIIITFLFFAE